MFVSQRVWGPAGGTLSAIVCCPVQPAVWAGVYYRLPVSEQRGTDMLKFLGGTVGIIFLIGLVVVIGILALIL